MKKLLIFVLCMSFILLAACGRNAPDGSISYVGPQYDTKIENTAAKGELDGIKFGIGADIDGVKSYFKKLAEDYNKEHQNDNHEDHTFGDFDDDYAYYNVVDKGNYAVVETAAARYYYDKDNRTAGIVAISSDSTVFGFTPGLTTKYEIEAEFKSEGKTVSAEKRDLELLAMPTASVLILRYTFEDYQLDFYFSDNMLISTAIVDTENWVY